MKIPQSQKINIFFFFKKAYEVIATVSLSRLKAASYLVLFYHTIFLIYFLSILTKEGIHYVSRK